MVDVGWLVSFPVCLPSSSSQPLRRAALHVNSLNVHPVWPGEEDHQWVGGIAKHVAKYAMKYENIVYFLFLSSPSLPPQQL